MFVGAHYTFSKVPLFDWIKDWLGQDRNNYDKFGHVFQGIVPVLIAREIFIRKKIITGEGWVNFLSFNVCATTALVYELIEFIACYTSGKNPDTFLGTQGYNWDSQTDMLAAVIGGLITIMFRKVHRRMMEKEFS
jgi:putative membrane protein